MICSRVLHAMQVNENQTAVYRAGPISFLNSGAMLALNKSLGMVAVFKVA